jgi:hypothetical protein
MGVSRYSQHISLLMLRVVIKANTLFSVSDHSTHTMQYHCHLRNPMPQNQNHAFYRSDP